MSLEESGRLYLEDFYLLESARQEAVTYLKGIADDLELAVLEELRQRVDSPVAYGHWVHSRGGAVDFFVQKQNLPALEGMGEWKFSVRYRDAMETGRLSDTKKCRIDATTPKANAAQRRIIERKAKELGLESPYEKAEYDLIGELADDVVEVLTRAFVERLDNYVRIVRALADEKSGQVAL